MKKEIPSHVLRMIDERKELSEKIKALQHFVGTPLHDKLEIIEQTDLKHQLEHMREYELCLVRRLKRFDSANNFVIRDLIFEE